MLKRHSQNDPCLICEGHQDQARGQGLRCIGFRTDDGWIHCSRLGEGTRAKYHEHSLTWSHRAAGYCPCGTEHAPDDGSNDEWKANHARPDSRPPQSRDPRPRIQAKPQSAEVRQIGDTPKARIVATYDYTTRDGRLLYQVCRTEPKSFRQRRPDGKGGWNWSMKANPAKGIPEQKTTLYRLPDLVPALQAGDRIYICFVPETEVLTDQGFVLLEDLSGDENVANYWPQRGGSIDFRKVRGLQSFSYRGSVVDFESTSKFCRLAVTPEHRMLAGYPKCKMRTIMASEIKAQHRLPVSGRTTGGVTVGESVARLVAAWQADGINEERGYKVSWNLKKPRKVKRLRMLLDAVGVAYTLHNYPSCPEWTNVRVRREALDQVTKWIEYDGPDKRFVRGVLRWELKARRILLDELSEWDGDRTGARGIRFFTACKSGADLVSELAATSGYSSILREDIRDYRTDQRPQYILNLIPTTERVLGNSPEMTPFDGRVNCLTTDSGFVVCRRHGAVTIAGQCEGEKDVEAVRSAGQTATCNTGGAGKWRDDLSGCFKSFWNRDYPSKILIVQDRDAPDHKGVSGQEHARRIYESLAEVLPDECQIVIVEAAEGKDAADHLAAGKSLEALVQVWPIPDDLIETNPEAFKKHMLRRALERPATALSRVSYDPDERALERSQPTYRTGVMLAPFYLNWRGAVSIAGEPSAGKSYVAISTAIDAALDGWDVFYLSCEMHQDIIRDRAARAVASSGASEWEIRDPVWRREAILRARTVSLPDQWHHLDVDAGVTIEMVVEMLADNVTYRPTLVVLDSISSFVDAMEDVTGGQDAFGMNNLKHVTKWTTGTRKLSHGHIAYILLSELNREGRAKGRALDHRCDTALSMKSDPENKRVKSIDVTKNWWGEAGKWGDFVLDWEIGRLVRHSNS